VPCARLSWHSGQLLSAREYIVSYCKLAFTRVQKPTQALFFVPCDLDLWPLDLKINGFPGLVVEHFCVRFCGPGFSSFCDIMQKNRQTQTDKPHPSTTIGIGNWMRDSAAADVRNCWVRMTLSVLYHYTKETVDEDCSFRHMLNSRFMALWNSSIHDALRTNIVR